MPNSVEGYSRSQHSKAGGAATQRATGRFRGQKERLRQARYLRIPKYIVRSRDAVVIVVNRLHSVRKLSTWDCELAITYYVRKNRFHLWPLVAILVLDRVLGVPVTERSRRSYLPGFAGPVSSPE